MITIRPECELDRIAIHRVCVEAFSASEFGHNGEAKLVDDLRSASASFLSLVALHGDEVVGHVFFTPVSLRSDDSRHHGMGLAPLAVTPSCQRTGIGSALVREGLRLLDEIDNSFCAVVGHPEFYQRFGFVPASGLRITHGFAGMPQEYLLIRKTDAFKAAAQSGGRLIYRPEFGPQDDGDTQ